MAQSTLNKIPSIEIEYDVTSLRFSVNTIEEIQHGIEHLNQYGYAVFSNVLSNEEVKHSVELFWEFLESLEKPYNIQRHDPKTWHRLWPGLPHIGLINDGGMGQSEFMWSIRGNPNIKKVFSNIWNSNELFISFDGAGCFRNWHINEKWKTSSGWYHCDQNPFRKPSRCSIQGLVALTDNDQSTGGLVVLPESHKDFLELLKTTDRNRTRGDYIAVSKQNAIFEKLRPRLVTCKAGDLVVWDSRCIHCNTPAIVDDKKNNLSEMLRIVAYICMSPLEMFVPDMNQYKDLSEFRRLREHFVRNRISCTHWPLEFVTADRDVREIKKSLKLNTYQHSLIIGTNIEPENGLTTIDF